MYNDWGLTEIAEVRLAQARIREDERAVARQIWRALHIWRQEHG
jgi:hypothetical protein